MAHSDQGGSDHASYRGVSQGGTRRSRDFGDLFSCEPQRRHFAEYLTGLMIAQNKTVTGINSELPRPRTSRA